MHPYLPILYVFAVGLIAAVGWARADWRRLWPRSEAERSRPKWAPPPGRSLSRGVQVMRAHDRRKLLGD